MPPMPAAVDLSRLPAPAFVEPLSFEAIYAAMRDKLVADMRALPGHAGFTVAEGDPTAKILQRAAYESLLLRQRQNEGALAVMPAYAGEGDLENLAALMGVERRVIEPGDPQQNIPRVLEPLEEFRARMVEAPEGFSVAGPEGAYIKHAKAADADVLDVQVASPAPAHVDLYVLARSGDGAPSAALLSKVEAAVSAKSVRPIGDRVQVMAPQPVAYAVAGVIRTFDGPDASLVVSQALARLGDYQAECRRIGRDVAYSGLLAALHAPGVQHVQLSSPAGDVVVADGQVAVCTHVEMIHEGLGG